LGRGKSVAPSNDCTPYSDERMEIKHGKRKSRTSFPRYDKAGRVNERWETVRKFPKEGDVARVSKKYQNVAGEGQKIMLSQKHQ